MPIKIWNWISNFATAWGLLPSSIATYITTAIWVVAMAAAAYVQSIDLYWVLLGLPLAAASIFTFVLRASELGERHRVKDKIVFEAPRIMRKTAPDGSVDGFCLGFQLQNHAAFPIDFELDALDTRFGTLYPPKKPYSKTRFTISARGVAWFDDHLIEIPRQAPNARVQGLVKFEISYGVGQRLRHKLSRKVDLFIGFDDKGAYEGSNWQEG
jgi:hypothetical protein